MTELLIALWVVAIGMLAVVPLGSIMPKWGLAFLAPIVGTAAYSLAGLSWSRLACSVPSPL